MFKGGLDKIGFHLIAPPINDSFCLYETAENFDELKRIIFNQMTTVNFVQSVIVLFVTLTIIVTNIIFIMVINSQSYSNWIQLQPRYLLTCLASNDMAIGFLITFTAILPTLLQCWPYGHIVCQLQALLRGSLTRQSSMILMCMAIERYIFAVHPQLYRKYVSNNKVCMLMICFTLISLLTIFATIVLVDGGFHFNRNSGVGCDLFYSRSSFRILSACILYFPTTMVLMFCYGKVYHINAAKLYFQRHIHNNYTSNQSRQRSIENFEENEDLVDDRISPNMAIISLSFTVIATPWTIYEVVSACTGYKIPPGLEFVITWTGFSNSFLNPCLYWLMDKDFRKISKNIFTKKESSITENLFNEGTELKNSKSKHATSNGVCKLVKFDTQISSNIYICPTPPPPPHINGKIWTSNL